MGRRCERPELAGQRPPPFPYEWLLHNACAPSRREGQLKAEDPPACASIRMGVIDPLPSIAVPRWPTAVQRSATVALQVSRP
jgi:hypothetical protein